MPPRSSPASTTRPRTTSTAYRAPWAAFATPWLTNWKPQPPLQQDPPTRSRGTQRIATNTRTQRNRATAGGSAVRDSMPQRCHHDRQALNRLLGRSTRHRDFGACRLATVAASDRPACAYCHPGCPRPGDETKNESVDPTRGSAMSVRERQAGFSGLRSPAGSTTPTIHCSAPSAVSCWNLSIEAGPVGNIVVVRATAAGGIGYIISGLGRHHERPACLLWPDQQFVRARSTTAAVTAIREDQALRSPRSHPTKSSRYASSRRPPEGAAALDRSPRRTGGPDGRHLPSALLGAVAIVWSSVSGEKCAQIAPR